MTAREQLDAYAATLLTDLHMELVRFDDTIETVAPEAITALRAVLDIADDCRNITGARTVGDAIDSAITTALEAT